MASEQLGSKSNRTFIVVFFFFLFFCFSFLWNDPWKGSIHQTNKQTKKIQSIAIQLRWNDFHKEYCFKLLKCMHKRSKVLMKTEKGRLGINFNFLSMNSIVLSSILGVSIIFFSAWLGKIYYQSNWFNLVY